MSEQKKSINSPDGFSYEEYRQRATSSSLSTIEKIGFPEALRRGKEDLIAEDILRKLRCLSEPGKSVIDIGPGCSDVAQRIVNICRQRGHMLTLIDSPEMLTQLNTEGGVRRIAGRFPYDVELAPLRMSADAVICYSVLHYEFSDGNLHHFVDAAMDLLRPGGSLLLGDIPNVSMRKRFLASDSGRRFHREFMGVETDPEVNFNVPELFHIDDAVLMSLVMRARTAGFHAFLLPQEPSLPMANRREDLLIQRP